MSFLDEYAALAGTTTDPAQLAKAQAGLARKWLTERTDDLFRELRESRPVFVAPGLAFVARHADVVEVLSRDRVFTVAPYAPRMHRTTGDFFLGMGRTPQYDREVSVMRLAAGRGDLDLVRGLAADKARALVAAAKGRLDLVNGYARAVALHVVQKYFGVPGPDDATLLEWGRALFWDIFQNLADDPAVRQRADAAGAGFADHLRRVIAARRADLAAGKPADDVTARLVRMQADPATALDDDGIRRNVGGTVVGAVETVSRAFVQAVAQLLARPDALAQARAAVAAGDDDRVARCVWEGMRFHPQNPFLYRLCTEPYTLAAGTPRATPIAANTLVFAGTKSAMLDPDRVPDPDAVRLDRPAECYLFFGFGQHTCFGQHVAGVEFRELGRALLGLPNLRAAAGPGIEFEGPFPNSFVVEWDA